MKAYELIAKPESWCRGTSAIDSEGDPVAAIASEAVAWCATGAIFKCYPDTSHDVCNKLRNSIVGTIGNWNDSVEHSEVVEKLKELDI